MSFSTIPVRSNDDKVDVGWWNILRTEGIALAAWLGSAFAAETQFTVANNQVAAASVTGLLFAGASVRSFEADVQIYRNTTGGGATELSARCKLIGTYKTVAASWDLTVSNVTGEEIVDFGPAGLLFSITSAGQVQYTSSNMTGTAATSKLKFRYSTMGIET
jgi:hypothetical protein